MVYYNENDPKAAAWLRELMRQGHIAPGYVDERSILEIQPHDLTEYSQHHFFAGIGGWSYALRLAGWPDYRPVWTGSCPCQPFSNAGKRRGKKDARHLWPVWSKLIAAFSPAIVFGEQVASKAGRVWLTGIRADLENMAYAVGAADLCAAGIGSPHIRQRLYWLANATEFGRREGQPNRRGSISGNDAADVWPRSADHCGTSRLADADGGNARAQRQQRSGQHGQQSEDLGAGGLAHAALPASERFGPQREQLHRSTTWSAFELLQCTDGKARRIEPGTFPLAHGVSGRVGLLRGYGNAIVPELASEFIQACEDTGMLT